MHDHHQQLEQFLAQVEKRAYRMALLATGSHSEALDIVQDAMCKLVEKYAGKDAAEWPPLFQRILQHRITDWHRRRGLRNKLFAWLGKSDDDPLDELPAAPKQQPEQQLDDHYFGHALQQALRRLPLRQQQAFLLRQWEGLDVAQTAAAMGCSSGSVKTHYSRAVNSLRAQLEEHRP